MNIRTQTWTIDNTYTLYTYRVQQLQTSPELVVLMHRVHKLKESGAVKTWTTLVIGEEAANLYDTLHHYGELTDTFQTAILVGQANLFFGDDLPDLFA